MPHIDLVDNMRKAPGKCLACNTTPNENGKPLPAIDLNVDVDWGNNAYICAECGGIIADLLGRPSAEEFEALKREYDQLTKDHTKLSTRHKKRGEELVDLAAGKKVERRVKKKRKKERV